MNTLYISDLDGTLLNTNAALSDYTATTLRQLIDGGLCFSVATARTWESGANILAPISLPVPVVLQNGALIYDTQTQRFVKKELIPAQTVRALIACVRAHGQSGFLYSHSEDFTRAYYESLPNPYLREFYEIRKNIYGKRLTHTDDFTAHAEEDIIYFTIQDSHENLAALHEAIQKLPGVGCAFYPDSYMRGCWFLEVFSCTASKKNAVRWLRETYGFGKVVGFGDNLNDLPLFEACDEAYAVANAREELKAAATGVIGSNESDGVARFLRGMK